MATHRTMDIAYTAAYNITQFWRKHKNRNKFADVKVVVNRDTGALVSNMVNGYPPLANTRTR